VGRDGFVASGFFFFQFLVVLASVEKVDCCLLTWLSALIGSTSVCCRIFGIICEHIHTGREWEALVPHLLRQSPLDFRTSVSIWGQGKGYWWHGLSADNVFISSPLLENIFIALNVLNWQCFPFSHLKMFPPFLRNVFSQPEVAHACDPPLGMLGQEDCEFKASPGYLERPCLKKKKKNLQSFDVVPLYKIWIFLWLV
jgi:hypothetical protein